MVPSESDPKPLLFTVHIFVLIFQVDMTRDMKSAQDIKLPCVRSTNEGKSIELIPEQS